MLKVNNISFEYFPGKPVLKNISLTLSQGEHLCVMGESGSGKSTLLKAIYGLIDATEGSLFWKEKQILGPSHHLVPGMEFFKYVPQNFDLMPYTTVEENIKKFLSRFFPEAAQERTEELLEVIELSSFAKEKVKNLSGGQQQRVAIARALANEPELLLLDEPFSQIDNFKKNSLRRKLFNYLKEKRISCIVATHDGNDALSFADHMIVIKENTIHAADTPQNLYQTKPGHYVASLFDDVNEIVLNGKPLLLYPKDIQIVKKSDHQASVEKAYFKGLYWLIAVKINGQSLFVQNEEEIGSGDSIYLQFPTVN